jgi:hypothetical protein
MAASFSEEHVDVKNASVYSTTLCLKDIREFVIQTQGLSDFAGISGLDRAGKASKLFGLRASVQTYLPE